MSELDPRIGGVPEVRGHDARVQDHYTGREAVEAERAGRAEVGRGRAEAEGVL